MSFSYLPPAQGLYDPAYEHDACGVGFVVDVHGRRSRGLLDNALDVLANLNHRGAQGSDPNTGDGAGLLMQIPHEALRLLVQPTDITLPGPGEYGVGMCFLPINKDQQLLIRRIVEEVVDEKRQRLLGWRDVPTNSSQLGTSAREDQPHISQVFIARGIGMEDSDSFERCLYIIRKLIENRVRQQIPQVANCFYLASLSHRTIVYKGMLTALQIRSFYPELDHPAMETAIALVHSRFSTNTFPSWDRAHPYRLLMHNGEINTVKGNENWMRAREPLLQSELFGDDMAAILPVIESSGSDSAKLDNILELMVLGGRSLAHSFMMLIPEPWKNHQNMSSEKKSFYEYHSCLMETWDGPASIAFTDGRQVGAVLDRNGLRPSRYWVTKGGLVVLASEVGVLDLPADEIVLKDRLRPGRMLLVDTEQGRIIDDTELKNEIAGAEDYGLWLRDNLIDLNDLPLDEEPERLYGSDLKSRQLAFGFTFEELRMILAPMSLSASEPIGSMGNDTPPAILSDTPKLLYSYFKQLFAQVTNPPIDAIREELVTDTVTTMGRKGNLLNAIPEDCRQIRLNNPLLSLEDMQRLRGLNGSRNGHHSVVVPMVFSRQGGGSALKSALDRIAELADVAIGNGATIIILSDRTIDNNKVAIPSLLATSSLHHHLIRTGKRTLVGIVVDSGEAREVHHMAVLIGYGANAICPYLALASLDEGIHSGVFLNDEEATRSGGSTTDRAERLAREAHNNYRKGLLKGIVKIISKMGISTIQAYHGAQIFESVGISRDIVKRYFTGTSARLSGIGIDEIATDAIALHQRGYAERPAGDRTLDAGGDIQWREGGEYHLNNPQTIHKLQRACQSGDYDLFKQYSADVDSQQEKLATLRGLLSLKQSRNSIPINEVEPASEIVKRFKTGAMSYGSISKEAHETLAIAMNRIGGKSNTGEGGEDPARYSPDTNGDSRNSAIKQVASARFGVTSHYLVNAEELQIKMAQGAKPGEGGQLPGKKVYPWIAEVRHSTPGVGLISPPPHHDIYSIEDLAELIHDLKNVNNEARINVKLVSEVGVGTVAAGVAKAHADVVLISGSEGGTGASPVTSIKHAGLPWELGIAETHQTLLLNDLRSRIVVEADGQLKTGRDVVIAALLGAEEFGFATAPVIVLGCIMMRVCHVNTCPVGIATQDPDLRKKFTGDPAHVVNFMNFVAEEARELMAALGFRSFNELVGRVDCIEPRQAIGHWKARGLDLGPLLYRPEIDSTVGTYCQINQEHGLERALDNVILRDLVLPQLDQGHSVRESLKITNSNRVVGTIIGSEITRRFGPEGLPDDTVSLEFTGSAGQSFGAFIPHGMTLTLVGDSNDYLGKGLSGGKIIVRPAPESLFAPEDNIITGNVSLYGATSGEAYISGVAGERFCVRNSGAISVVEGVGDHGCEYMTGGQVVVLGATGRNFAAGMSGGIAYVLDNDGSFLMNFNSDMAEALPVHDPADIKDLREMVEKHVVYTESPLAQSVLEEWETALSRFVKIYPRDYRRMHESIANVKAKGFVGDEAVMAAFELNLNDVAARSTGN